MCDVTTIVNIRHQRCDINCSRPSIFSNPYHIGRDGTRSEVCEKYKKHFYNKLHDPSFRSKVHSLKNKKLGCWCVPKRCHLETILEYLLTIQ